MEASAIATTPHLPLTLVVMCRSPNAQGYISGSISELLLKNHLESLGYMVERIREKWEGSLRLRQEKMNSILFQ